MRAPCAHLDPITHCCRQRHKTWPKRLALALRTVLAWPKLPSKGSTSSSWVGKGIQGSPGTAVVPTDQASQLKALCAWGTVLVHGGSVHPTPPAPTVGNAWGCP